MTPTPPPDNKKRLLMIAGALTLIAIICIAIAVFVFGAFPASPQKNIPSLNVSPAISVYSVIPPRGASGTLVPVTIEGENFTYGPSPTIRLVKSGERDIYAADIMVISPTRITCIFPLTSPSLSAGQWEVFLQNTGEQSGSKLGVFTVADEIAPALIWDWSKDGWGDWQHGATCSGTTGKGTGSCLEYGPVVENGNGVQGSNVTLDRVATESSVWKTFTAPSDARWNTITFSGLLSSSSLPFRRWMAVDVNGERVFYSNATRTPPGNGQTFTVTQSFLPANKVTIRISQGQGPTWGTSLYTMQFDSLTLS